MASEVIECPWCGQVFLEEMALTVHASQVHPEWDSGDAANQ